MTRAKAAGAEIVIELKDTEYGSREYQRPRSGRAALAFRHVPARVMTHAQDSLFCAGSRRCCPR